MRRSLALLVLTASLVALDAVPSARGDDVPETVGRTLTRLPRAAGAQTASEASSDVVEAGMSFSMVGVETDPGVDVWIRVADGADWQPWTPLDVVDDEGPDDVVDQPRRFTEPLWVGRADRLQVRVRGGALERVEVHVIDSMGHHRSTLERVVGALGPDPAGAVLRPPVVSRQAWGADESLRRHSPSRAGVLHGVVHHTAGSNDYTRAESPAIVRGIYYYHTVGRGWNDIGYNLLVDRFGQVFEGRFGGLTSGVIGAHAAGFNTGSFGIAYMGNTNDAGVTNAAIRSLARAIAWQYEAYGLDPEPRAHLSRHGRRLHTLSGHRHVGSTSCPGARLTDRLDELRRRVGHAVMANHQVVVGDFNGDGYSRPGWMDRVGRWDAAKWNTAGAPVIRFAGQLAGDVALAGDWDGDGIDTPAVVRGDTWIVSNDRYGAQAERSFRFGNVRGGDVPIVGDWDGDGIDTIGVVRGNRFLLRNRNSGGPAHVSFNYGAPGDRVVVGDWDGDGRDTVGVVRAGWWYLRDELAGGNADRVFPFGRPMRTDDRPLAGDWDGDGDDTVGVLRGSRFLLTNRNGVGPAAHRYAYRGRG